MRVGTFVLAGQYPGQGHAEALHRAVRAAEVSEESGLDTVWLGEHHFVPYGTCPSAITLAALLLGRTRRIRVGTAVSVLPTLHPVALGEQAALLHVTAGGRLSLGVGRGGPWVDLEVFGTGAEAYEKGFPESLELLLRWLREPRVGAAGERYAFREVPVVPWASEPPHPMPKPTPAERLTPTDAPTPADHSTPANDPAPTDRPTPTASPASPAHRAATAAPPAAPEVLVACTSPGSVRLAAEHGLPMLLGMHCDDQEKADMVTLWRSHARTAGRSHEEIMTAGHVSAGVVQIADSTAEAERILLDAMPGWFRQGLGAHVTVDGRPRPMRDPRPYTELLCGLHPVGTPALCADRIAATARHTGITRFALLAEGSGDLATTEENVRRLGTEVLPQLL